MSDDFDLFNDDAEELPEMQPEQPVVAEKTDAQLRCEKLLRNAGIEAEPFLIRLAKLKQPISPEAFIAIADDAFSNMQSRGKSRKELEKGSQTNSTSPLKVEHSTQAALAMRAIFLQTKDPQRTTLTLLKMASLKHDKKLTQAASILGLLGDGKATITHYTGIGFGTALSVLWDSRRFIKINVESKGRFLPKVSGKFRTEKTGFNDKVYEIAEKFISKTLTNKNKRHATEHLSEFFSLDPSGLQSVLQAVQDVMKEPQSKELIMKLFAQENTAEAQNNQTEGKKSLKELNEQAVATMLRAVLSVTAKLHDSEYNIQRVAQFVAVMTKDRAGEENNAEVLAEFWEKETTARASARGEKVESGQEPASVLVTPKEPEKITFANNPKVNLGAAIVAPILAVWAGSALSKKTKDKDGKQHPPSGWKKAAKWLIITALTVATGMAAWRAATLPREDGISWVERTFDPSLGGKQKGAARL